MGDDLGHNSTRFLRGRTSQQGGGRLISLQSLAPVTELFVRGYKCTNAYVDEGREKERGREVISLYLGLKESEKTKTKHTRLTPLLNCLI